MRRPDKWSRPAVEAIVGVPWCLTGDGEAAIPKVVFEDREVEEPAPETAQTAAAAPRRLRRSRDDLDTHTVSQSDVQGAKRPGTQEPQGRAQ